MHTPHRRSIAATAAALTLAAGGGFAAAASAGSTSGEPDPAAITALDAQARASAEAGEPVQVYDSGTKALVQMSQADMEAEQRRASAEDGYLDADGNPRYILVWRNGTLVPGPELTSAASKVPGEPATCSVEG